MAVLLSREELAAIRKHGESGYPAESCGVILVRPVGERRLYACHNIQDELHRRDPQRYPRDSSQAYCMSREDMEEIERGLSDGYALDVIYHSHVDVGAYFSETDRRHAAPAGEPTYPGAAYVVVAVEAGEAGDVKAFRWDGATCDFAEVPLVVD